MDRLEYIIRQIDSNITNNVSLSVKSYGLCDSRRENKGGADEVYLFTVGANPIEVVPNDSQNLMTAHVLGRSSVSEVESRYGYEITQNIEVALVGILINKPEITNYAFGQKLMNNINAYDWLQLRNNLSANYIRCSVKNINYQANSVYRKNWQLNDNTIDPHIRYVELAYTITLKYNTNCIDFSCNFETINC